MSKKNGDLFVYLFILVDESLLTHPVHLHLK